MTALVLIASSAPLAQTRGTSTPRPPATAPKTTPKAPTPAPASAKPGERKTEPAMMTCPQPLGAGVRTQRMFCDVLIERDPNRGIIITLPPHSGPAILTFDLHNRHTYSEDDVRNGRGYHRYISSIGVMAMDNTLLSRAAIMSEFRTSADLVDRIVGVGSPGGVKAVTPTGTEPISITIDPGEDKVSILGEKLTEMRTDGQRDEWQTIDRPIAIISNVMVEYQPPAPARRTTPARRR